MKQDTSKSLVPFWFKFVPALVRSRLESRNTLQLIITNTGWLFADRVMRMGVGLFVGVWVARYLGPEQFGMYNYAIAFVGLFSAFASLGLDGIVVRDMVRNPTAKDEILGSAFLLKLIGWFVTLFIIAVVIFLLRPKDSLMLWLVGIIAVGGMFQPFEVIDFWFQSQVLSKYTVYAKNAAFLIMSIVKIFLIMTKASLILFAIAGLIEIAIGALGLVIAYRINGHSLVAWKSSFSKCTELLSTSWPFILSGLSVMIFMKVDLVMLGEMVDSKAVGNYSAAIRLSEIWYFIPVAIVSSVLPSIIKAKKENEGLYYLRLQKLFSLMVVLALVIVVPMSFLSTKLVVLLFGEGFIRAGPVLAIHIWSALFVFLGCAHGPFWLAENLQIGALWLTIIGAVLNVLLNLFLIPSYQETGAAIATLISYAIPNTIALVFFKQTRPLLMMTINAMANPLKGLKQ